MRLPAVRSTRWTAAGRATQVTGSSAGWPRHKPDGRLRASAHQDQRRRDQCRRSAAGPPAAPVHGNPLTHVSWHKIAPTLAKASRSSRPTCAAMATARSPTAAPTMPPIRSAPWAKTLSTSWTRLASSTFAVAGHDRGARVGFRMALDQPERVDAPLRARHRPDHQSPDPCDARLGRWNPITGSSWRRRSRSRKS